MPECASVKITFPFGGTVSAPSQVIWTVSFNTSTWGYSPIGPASCSPVITTPPSDPGCGYDSLNVGAWAYTNAPYSGADLDADLAFRSFWTGSPPAVNPLAVESGWDGLTPLAEIRIG
jgi:hypothetical protein